MRDAPICLGFWPGRRQAKVAISVQWSDFERRIYLLGAEVLQFDGGGEIFYKSKRNCLLLASAPWDQDGVFLDGRHANRLAVFSEAEAFEACVVSGRHDLQ